MSDQPKRVRGRPGSSASERPRAAPRPSRGPLAGKRAAEPAEPSSASDRIAQQQQPSATRTRNDALALGASEQRLSDHTRLPLDDQRGVRQQAARVAAIGPPLGSRTDQVQRRPGGARDPSAEFERRPVVPCGAEPCVTTSRAPRRPRDEPRPARPTLAVPWPDPVAAAAVGQRGCARGQPLRRFQSRDAAAVYAEASLAALEMVAELADREAIACDLERRPAFTYAADGERSTIEDEYEAARESGLPVSLRRGRGPPLCDVRRGPSWTTSSNFIRSATSRVSPAQSTATALRARADAGDRSRVGWSLPGANRGRNRDSPNRSSWPPTTRCSTVASSSPASSRAARTASRRAAGARRRRGVDIGRRDHALGSLLRRPAHPRGRGAYDRRAASRSGRYERLELFAREHWEIDKVSHRWSAQDPTRWDLLPVIGRYHPRSSRLFVASGFNKWGLTSGTFAARIIRDLIAGRPSSWTDVFDPNRIGARGARSWPR